jgi:hypothetical protein
MDFVPIMLPESTAPARRPRDGAVTRAKIFGHARVTARRVTAT